MDTDIPRRQDDLSDMERRLSGWRPSAEGLVADAMLFAAGLAAGRSSRGRLLVPALCGLLAVLGAGLSVWALTERAERQALARRLGERDSAPHGSRATAVAVLPAPSYMPSTGDYFHQRRQLEQDSSRWLASAQPVGPQVAVPPPEPVILRAGQRDAVLEQ